MANTHLLELALAVCGTLTLSIVGRALWDIWQNPKVLARVKG